MAANIFIYDEPYDQGKHKKGTQHCHITNTNGDGLNNHYEDLDQVMSRISLANKEHHYNNDVMNTKHANDNNGDVQHTRLIHRNKRMVIGVLVGLFIGSLISGAVVFLISKYYTSISNIEGGLNQDNLVTPGTTEKYSDGDDRISGERMKTDRPGFPGYWDRFQGVHYWISNHSSNFTTAQTFCSNRSGYLVEIKTSVTCKFLQLLVSTRDTGRYWIGLTNLPNGGPWRWDQSNTLLNPSLANWEEGQPEKRNEHCVTLQKTKAKGEFYQWHDWFCSSTHPFICTF